MGILLRLELIINVSDKFISLKQMLIRLPLIKYVIPLLRRADRIQHIGIGLAVYALLEGLDIEAEIHLIGRDVFSHAGKVGSLYAVQEHQE